MFFKNIFKYVHIILLKIQTFLAKIGFSLNEKIVKEILIFNVFLNALFINTCWIRILILLMALLPILVLDY